MAYLTMAAVDTGRNTKDIKALSNDKVIKEANKRIAAIEKEKLALTKKIAKRANDTLLKIALEIIDNTKLAIHGVDTYRKDKSFFQLSFSVVHEIQESGAPMILKKGRSLGATTMIAPSGTGIMVSKAIKKLRTNNGCEDLRLPPLRNLVSLSDISYGMECYGISQFEIDDCYMSFGYDTITLSSSGDKSKDLVFALAKKLRLKIDYASYVRSTEFAEAEIAARKQLIEHLSDTILFQM
jgi:hypothetical protein